MPPSTSHSRTCGWRSMRIAPRPPPLPSRLRRKPDKLCASCDERSTPTSHPRRLCPRFRPPSAPKSRSAPRRRSGRRRPLERRSRPHSRSRLLRGLCPVRPLSRSARSSHLPAASRRTKTDLLTPPAKDLVSLSERMSTPRRLLAQALLLDDPEHCYEALGAEIFSLGHFAHSRRSDDGESSRRSRILGAANRVPQVPATTLHQRACQRAGQSVAILSAATVLTRARLRYQHGAARTRVRTSRKDGQGWARLLPGRIATQLAVDLGTVSHHLPPPLRTVPRCAGKPRSQVSAQLTLPDSADPPQHDHLFGGSRP